MTFVVFGVIILILSFVIALISLLREQSKLEKVSGRDRRIDDSLVSTEVIVKKDVHVPPADLSFVNSLQDTTVPALQSSGQTPSLVPALEPPLKVEDREEPLDRALFPWKVAKDASSQPIGEEQKAIEDIKAQLARIKMDRIAGEQSYAGQAENTKDDIASTRGSSIVPKLSGRFSVKELAEKI